MAYIGIDTSNYTSSCCLAENGRIIGDYRKLLSVKEGQLGLRQSDALYQHWGNLPVLIEALFSDVKKYDLSIEAIVVSVKPRPQEGSYMPVFNAGYDAAKMLAASLNVPVFIRSHQEGHILAASYENDIDFSKALVCAHLSGGTLELVKLENGLLTIIGGTKDISYGQLIDRVGVIYGMRFPCGKEIDSIACNFKALDKKSPFKDPHIESTFINLSGLETQIKQLILQNEFSRDEILYYLMSAISKSFISIIKNTGIKQVLVSGGVAASTFLRNSCKNEKYIFGRPDLCSDNACGLALSEGKLPW